MLAVRSSPPASLELSGTAADLGLLRRELLGLAADGMEARIVAADPGFEPAPYDRCLASIRVLGADGPMQIDVVEDELVLAGGAVALAAFADAIAELAPGRHLHWESLPGIESALIAADAIPLVVSARAG